MMNNPQFSHKTWPSFCFRSAHHSSAQTHWISVNKITCPFCEIWELVNSFQTVSSQVQIKSKSNLSADPKMLSCICQPHKNQIKEDVEPSYCKWLKVGLLNYGKNYNNDNLNNYFWVWKHDAFISHFSPKKKKIWIFPFKIHKMFKLKTMCSSVSIKHLMNKINTLVANILIK